MSIMILRYIDDVRGSKLGTVDIKVEVSPEKSRTFRNLGHFKTDKGEWINMSNCKRDDKWVPTYEEEPSLRPFFSSVLDKLKEYLKSRPKQKETTQADWGF